MKKLILVASFALFVFSVLPVFALETGIGYGTIIGLGTRDVREVVMLIIQVIFGFLGILAIVGILAGGFIMMTAGGNEDKSGTGKKVIIAGVVGLVIVLTAFALATFVVNQLVGVTF